MSIEEILQNAVAARTDEDARRTQELIIEHVGAEYKRPLGDRWNNFGLISAGGSYDHKLIENVTNMQDAVVEREAVARFGALDRVPFSTPREASQALFSGLEYQEVADRATVEFFESDPPTNESRCISIVFRDAGCGLTTEQIPETMFRLGSPHKDALPWLQGAFGLGGATTFRNSRAVVLISRRAPELLEPGETDRISVAVLMWESHAKGKGAYYLATSPWDEHRGGGLPFSAPAQDYPEFTPGTQLTLISYGVEGYHRRYLGDERSFDTVLNTRLFEPITPVRFTHFTRERNEYLRGLRHRLEASDRPEVQEGSEILPYSADGTTYHLPVRYYVFPKQGDPGARRRFVAYEHAVVFTSNGQVHYHWTPQQFKLKTGLTKLFNRVYIVVETDDLPIQFRTSLFTADRAELVRSDLAIRLEDAVAGFLSDWPELRDINGQLLREALAGNGDGGATRGVADQISRALQVRGFSQGGTGTTGGGGGGGGRNPQPPVELYEDPTTLEGPAHAQAEVGKTKFVTYVINAVDGFIPRRGQLSVVCGHPDVNDREITVGELRGGRIRISVAIPVGAENGTVDLEVSLSGWLRSRGGLGPDLAWTTQLEVVDEIDRRTNGAGRGRGSRGPGPGNTVALQWRRHDQVDGWSRVTVGAVELVEAQVLAQEQAEYADLAPLGSQRIPLVMLNADYPPLRKYLDARVRDLVSIDTVRSRYAVGTGVGLLLLDADAKKRQEGGEAVSDKWIAAASVAVARGVLSIMPSFDELARAAGMEE